MLITPIYAALLALLFSVLSTRTLLLRRAKQIPLGDAGDKQLQRRMRVHANFAEYTPLSLIVLFMLESQGGTPWLVHLLCLCLLLGRVLHAYGVSQPREDFRFRVAGMSLTFFALIGAALGLLVMYVSAV